MADKNLENRSTSLENCPMQTAEAVTRDAQTMARTIARAFGASRSVKEIIHHLAGVLRVTERQAKSIYYGEPHAIPAHVFLRLLAAYRNNLERLQRQAEHQAAMYRTLNNEWESKWGNSFCAGELSSLESALSEPCTAPSITAR
ncbi:hypothetical protein K2X14_11490 [Acetobacter sp. TBRC 12305]|uniref:Uncharacterized protein n=1 Tax=Acetobacter garciniae TaxID=2817435 RepID=A0A939HKV9_9PROT|nr:hypothetical protein [Acetobacter garciniae]MBO1325367.1 hypothetical protein [Acetobacter garciniae]MBX0345461.1 hypothetical protein [Acetobacter garciniae]